MPPKPGKPLSWQWKVTIAVVVIVLFGIGFLFSGMGHEWMLGRLTTAFEETPENERFTSTLADQYLNWAWFKEVVCQDDDAAMDMYKKFCGYDVKLAEADKYALKAMNSGKLLGLCSEKGLTGWGPRHPRAPEAYFRYVKIFAPKKSSQAIKREIANYFRLFYTWHIRYSGTKKPHPLFNKFWPKLMIMAQRSNWQFPEDINPGAPLAAPFRQDDD